MANGANGAVGSSDIALPSTRAIETRSLPTSLAATHRGFAFYVAFPKSSIPSLARVLHLIFIFLGDGEALGFFSAFCASLSVVSASVMSHGLNLGPLVAM